MPGKNYGFGTIIEFFGWYLLWSLLMGGCWYNAATTFNFYGGIFDDFPWLAYFLALVAPAAAICLEGHGSYIKDDRGKLRYKKFLSYSAIGLGVVWIALFVWQFNGFKESMTIDPQLSLILENIFFLVQIFAEVFCAGAVFMKISALHSEFSKERYIKNPAHKELKKLLRVKEAKKKKLIERRKNIRSALQGFKDRMACFVQEKLDDLALGQAYLAARSNQKQ